MKQKKLGYAGRLFGAGLVLIAMAVAAACARIDGSSSSSNPGTSLVPTATPTATAAYIFKVGISTAYETSPSVTTEFGECAIPSSLAGSSVYSGTPYTCPDFTIPEIQLYYSKVTFAITSAENTCKIISFRPYNYLISNMAGYNAPDGTTIDCSANPRPIACYGGLAMDIVPSYPTNGGIYFLTDDSLTKSYTATSANLKRQGGGAYTGLTNRWAANNASPGTRAAGIANELVANQFYDYQITCLDDNDIQFVMTFGITTSTGAFSASDNFATWP